MFVPVLNGFVRAEDALCGKKTGVHVGAGTQVRAHRCLNVVVTRNHIGQFLLNVADSIEDDHTNLDVEAIGLRLRLDLIKERLSLVVDCLIVGKGRLIENKHDVRRLGLALAREREGDLGLQILVELGRCLLILVKDGRLISRRRIFGICRHRRHRHAKRQDRTHSKSERASQPPPLKRFQKFHICSFHHIYA